MGHGRRQGGDRSRRARARGCCGDGSKGVGRRPRNGNRRVLVLGRGVGSREGGGGRDEGHLVRLPTFCRLNNLVVSKGEGGGMDRSELGKHKVGILSTIGMYYWGQ